MKSDKEIEDDYIADWAAHAGRVNWTDFKIGQLTDLITEVHFAVGDFELGDPEGLPPTTAKGLALHLRQIAARLERHPMPEEQRLERVEGQRKRCVESGKSAEESGPGGWVLYKREWSR